LINDYAGPFIIGHFRAAQSQSGRHRAQAQFASRQRPWHDKPAFAAHVDPAVAEDRGGPSSIVTPLTQDRLMFFALSKLVGNLILPVNLTLILVPLAALLRLFGLNRLSTVLFCIAGVLLAVMLFTPLDTWLLRPLESRFPQMDRPMVARGDYAGIIVLGGPEDGRLTQKHGQVSFGMAGERFTETAVLARLRPDLPVVFTGGSGFYGSPEARGGPVAQRILTDLGVVEDRLIIESESRNTYQNALLSKPLVNSVSDKPWILVTSAAHMPRSYGIFTALDWNVVAYPVDYNFLEARWGWNEYRFVDRLLLINLAAREWIGLVAYKLTGRIAHWFPAPRQKM